MVKKHIKRHRLHVGLPLAGLLSIHFLRLYAILGISGAADVAGIWLGDRLGFNLGTVLIALSAGLLIWWVVEKVK